MEIVGIYSFNHGTDYIDEHYSHLLEEVKQAIQQVNADHHKTKSSKEKTMPDRLLYSPIGLNRDFKRRFSDLDWQTQNRIVCEYPSQYYTVGYTAPQNSSSS